MVEQSSTYVDVDGLRLRLKSYGRQGVGETCFLIHGLGDGAFVWDFFAREIGRYFDVVAIDLRGHGDSDWAPSGKYPLATYVEDVECVLRQLGRKQYILIGHSLGGRIAADIAASARQDILSTILVDSGPPLAQDLRLHFHAQLLEGHRVYQAVADYVRWVQERRPLVSPHVLSAIADQRMKPVEGGCLPKFDIRAADELLREEGEVAWWERLGALNVPTLIIRGIGSAFLTKNVAAAAAQANPAITLATVDFAGHAVMEDNPAGFFDVAKTFLDRFRQLQ